MFVKGLASLLIIGLVVLVHYAWHRSHIQFIRLIEMIYDQTGDDYRSIVNRDRFIEAMAEAGGSEWQRLIRKIIFTKEYGNFEALREQKKKIRRYALLMFLSIFSIFLCGVLLILGDF
jgi:hypothetical protein